MSHESPLQKISIIIISITVISSLYLYVGVPEIGIVEGADDYKLDPTGKLKLKANRLEIKDFSDDYNNYASFIIDIREIKNASVHCDINSNSENCELRLGLVTSVIGKETEINQMYEFIRDIVLHRRESYLKE